MRIVFLSFNYSPDIHSPEDWLDRISIYVGWAECLAREHTVVRIEQINFEGNFTHNGIQYYCVNAGKKINYFPWKLNRFVKSLNPDIVIVSSFLFPLQVIQLSKSLGRKVKIIVQNHAEKPFTGIKKFVQSFASRKVHAFLFTSYKTGLEWVINKNIDTGEKIHEMVEVSSVFYPVDPVTAREKTAISGSPVFLWVGRLNQNKDPATAIKAFLKFAEIQPSAKLYMIYQTAELLPDLYNLFTPGNKANRVEFIGKIKHDDLLYWYNSADFYLSASHYEGSGTALCEAMSCGCIPVVSDIPSFRMISGNSGLLYEAGNANDLFSELMKTVHLNVKEKKNHALSHFKNELSFEAIARKFQQLIGSL